MIHQGHAVVESQGVLIAECGPGEFLGEAGSGSSGVMETHLGGDQRSSKSMASLMDLMTLVFLGYRSISLKWTDLGNKNYGQDGRHAFFGIHWIDWDLCITVQESRRFLVVMFWNGFSFPSKLQLETTFRGRWQSWAFPKPPVLQSGRRRRSSHTRWRWLFHPFSDEKSPPKLIFVSFLLFFPVNSWRYLQKFTATPPKTNMEPQNWWFVDVSPFLRVYFQVPCWFSGVYLLHQPPRFAQMSGTFDAGGVRWIPRRASEIKRALVFLRGANLGWFQDANNPFKPQLLGLGEVYTKASTDFSKRFKSDNWSIIVSIRTTTSNFLWTATFQIVVTHFARCEMRRLWIRELQRTSMRKPASNWPPNPSALAKG